MAAAMTLGLVAVGLATPLAASAATLEVCSDGCAYSSIQAAVDSASAGDTIVVSSDLTVAGTTVVNKDVTVVGDEGVTITQTVNAITFDLAATGATLENLEITSTVPFAKEFVYIRANNVSLIDNTIYGPAQTLPMGQWVTNRAFVTAPGSQGSVIDGNTFYSLRSGAYLNPGSTGTATSNVAYYTKGDFLIDNANFTFVDNEAGSRTQPSEWTFVIFPGTEKTLYTNLAALSAANNYMSVLDQRTTPPTQIKHVILYDKDDCKNGGWKDSTAPKFKNQGACVSSFASAK